jgi:phosphoserine/homoserine phosphotransferase
VIASLRPLPGAVSFLRKLKAKHQVIILSDTFYEFAQPLMKQLDYPALFCNFLNVNRAGYIVSHRMRQENGKEKAVRAFRQLSFNVIAAGDSFNDLGMLKAANQGILFRPPASIQKKHKKFPVTQTHHQLQRVIARHGG